MRSPVAVTLWILVVSFIVLGHPRLSLAGSDAAHQNSRPSSQPGSPAPVEGDFTVRDFHFKDGETLPELRLHYRTLGSPHRDAGRRVNNAVLVMHGTGGSGSAFL